MVAFGRDLSPKQKDWGGRRPHSPATLSAPRRPRCSERPFPIHPRPPGVGRPPPPATASRAAPLASPAGCHQAAHVGDTPSLQALGRDGLRPEPASVSDRVRRTPRPRQPCRCLARASVCPHAARAPACRPPLLWSHAPHVRISHKPGLPAGAGPSPPHGLPVHVLPLSAAEPPAVPGLRVWPEVLEVEVASGGRAEGTAGHCGSWGPDRSTPLTPPHGLKFRT